MRARAQTVIKAFYAARYHLTIAFLLLWGIFSLVIISADAFRRSEWLGSYREFRLDRPGIDLVYLCDESDVCTSKKYQMFNGAIKVGSIETALESFNAAGEKNILVLNSPGGQMDAMAALARWMTRHPGVSLYVTGEYRPVEDQYWGRSNVPFSARCQSLCALWFTMAQKRVMIGNPRKVLMVHPPIDTGFYGGYDATKKISRADVDAQRAKIDSYLLPTSLPADERRWREEFLNLAFDVAPPSGIYLGLEGAVKQAGLLTHLCDVKGSDAELRCRHLQGKR